MTFTGALEPDRAKVRADLLMRDATSVASTSGELSAWTNSTESGVNRGWSGPADATSDADPVTSAAGVTDAASSAARNAARAESSDW